MTLPARHEHDCDKCAYLGQWQEYDLYFCAQNGWPTVIARYGPEGQYQSGLIFGKDGTIPALRVAYQRAIERGLLPSDIPSGGIA